MRARPATPPTLAVLAATAVLAALTATATPARADDGSGAYDELLLGVDAKSGLVTGWFESSTGEGRQFTCAFSFSGKLKPGGVEAEISVGHPAQKERVKGTLSLRSRKGRRVVALKLSDDPGGCFNVIPNLTGWNEWERTRSGDWTAVRVVSSKKAYFHDQPSAATRGKTYVVRLNVLTTDQVQGEFVHAAYRSDKGRVTAGWVLAADLFAL
jgi:hypothetical protein